VPGDRAEQSRQDHARGDDLLYDETVAHRLCDRGAAEEDGGEVERRGPDDGRERAEYAGAHDRRDRVRGVVEAVDEVERERDQDDRENVDDQGTSRSAVLEGDALEDVQDVLTLVDRVLDVVVE